MTKAEIRIDLQDVGICKIVSCDIKIDILNEHFNTYQQFGYTSFMYWIAENLFMVCPIKLTFSQEVDIRNYMKIKNGECSNEMKISKYLENIEWEVDKFG